MNKKALFVATAGRFLNFEKNDIDILKSMGYEVHCAANMNISERDKIPEIGVIKHQIDFARSPLAVSNIKAYKQLTMLMIETHFDLVHCHTPVGGVLGRLVAQKHRQHGTKIFYTAHGFHFYKGASIKNWLLYYPVEKLCSYWTDVLITINKEDYILAQEQMHAKRIEYIPGIGIDLKKFVPNILLEEDKIKLRASLGMKVNDKILLSVGELNKNKNHEVVIRAIAMLKNENIHYVIAGVGDLKDYLINLAKTLGISEQIHLLGFRTDIDKLYNIADVCVFPSIREGLGLAAIEGIACGLPIIVADNRGTREYAFDGINAIVCKYDNISEFASAIEKLCSDIQLCHTMGMQGVLIVKKFDIENTKKIMQKIYKD